MHLQNIYIRFSSLNALHSCYRLSVIAAPVINLRNSRKRCKSDHYSNHYNAVHRSEERKRRTAASWRRDDIIHTTRLFGSLSNVIKYRGLSTFSLIVTVALSFCRMSREGGKINKRVIINGAISLTRAQNVSRACGEPRDYLSRRVHLIIRLVNSFTFVS